MLKIEKMDFGYHKMVPLFRALDFEVKRGNIYGLLGKNGAGKSSLLKIMMGLLYPNSGTLSFEGLDVTKRLPAVLEDIFFIPEEFYLPDLSSDKYIKHYGGFYPKFDEQMMRRLLVEFELEGITSLKHLSFGMKKKYLIAFALATGCSLVLMDEPTNGLDIPSKSKFRKIVASEISEKRSIIISTHQVRDLENLIDPLVIIENGKIIFEQNIENLCKKMIFSREKTSYETNESTLYQESIFGGTYVIEKNSTQQESPLDFELLFNAVLANCEAITNHLNQ